MRNTEDGKVGWVLLWLVGIPIPILVGCFCCVGAPEAIHVYPKLTNLMFL
jgi:hypothetical protein